MVSDLKIGLELMVKSQESLVIFSNPMMPVATTRRHFLQVGVRPWRCRRLAAQRSALETRLTQWLPHVLYPRQW
ncbi:hypothetical protein [Calothrix sp. NIES-2098]|uniref:hypothetical protein n=1 Tax=Calothrix sp. NIES-2098 TaxID=1954171 RepID=UPI0030DC1D1A